jgi:hypothetical protein
MENQDKAHSILVFLFFPSQHALTWQVSRQKGFATGQAAFFHFRVRESRIFRAKASSLRSSFCYGSKPFHSELSRQNRNGSAGGLRPTMTLYRRRGAIYAPALPPPPLLLDRMDRVIKLLQL